MSSKKQSKKQEDEVGAEQAAPQSVTILPDEPVSKVSINKYDPFQLKGSIDDECVIVSDLNHELFRCSKKKVSLRITSTQT